MHPSFLPPSHGFSSIPGDSLVDNSSSRFVASSTYCWEQCRHFDGVYESSVEWTGILPWLKFWSKAILRRLIFTYQSSPICLIVLPLGVGIMVGWILARYCGGLESRNIVTRTTKAQKSFSSSSSSSSSKIVAQTRAICVPVFSFIFASFWKCVNAIVMPFSCWRTILAGDVDGRLQFSEHELKMKEAAARKERGVEDQIFESGIPRDELPQHIAVIMDGNRRYGKAKYGVASKGHWDGSKKLCDFARWCQSEGVQVLTVYAFSTENWSRDQAEVESLMSIILKYCDEIRIDAIKRGMKVRILSTDKEKIPQDVKDGLKKLMDETSHCDKFLFNICLSYGSRSEIVNTCKSIVNEVQEGRTTINDIDETYFGQRLLAGSQCPDPDILIRTSGEYRISNFQLWQLAYAELFFIDRKWPELEKRDLIDIIRRFATGRQRRYGK